MALPRTQPWQLPSDGTYDFTDPAFTGQGQQEPLTTGGPAFLRSNGFRLWFLGFMGLLVLADIAPAVAAGIAAVIFAEAAFAATAHSIGSAGQ